MRRVKLRSASLVAFAATLLFVCSTASFAKPKRIVSLNYCADKMLLDLVPRERIAAVTNWAKDPRISDIVEETRGIPITYGRAEEVLALTPDLVVTASNTTRETSSLLRHLGYEVLELPLVVDFDDLRRNVEKLAEAVGEGGRGSAILARFERRIDAAAKDAARRPLALLYLANGYSTGLGTFEDEVLKAGGFRNLASEMGLRGYVQVSLEVVMSARPELIILPSERYADSSLAVESVQHPALERARQWSEQYLVPENVWGCGVPEIASLIENLAEKRRAMSVGGAKGDD